MKKVKSSTLTPLDKSIYDKIEDIEFFMEKCDGKIMKILQDRVYKLATRMQYLKSLSFKTKNNNKAYLK